MDALSEQNIISYNEVVDLCIANGQAKKKMLDDKLDTLSSGNMHFTLVKNVFDYSNRTLITLTKAFQNLVNWKFEFDNLRFHFEFFLTSAVSNIN